MWPFQCNALSHERRFTAALSTLDNIHVGILRSHEGVAARMDTLTEELGRLSALRKKVLITLGQ